jgi:hypothetical protein
MQSATKESEAKCVHSVKKRQETSDDDDSNVLLCFIPLMVSCDASVAGNPNSNSPILNFINFKSSDPVLTVTMSQRFKRLFTSNVLCGL